MFPSVHAYGAGGLTLIISLLVSLVCWFKAEEIGDFGNRSYWLLTGPLWIVPVIWIIYFYARQRFYYHYY